MANSSCTSCVVLMLGLAQGHRSSMTSANVTATTAATSAAVIAATGAGLGPRAFLKRLQPAASSAPAGPGTVAGQARKGPQVAGQARKGPQVEEEGVSASQTAPGSCPNILGAPQVGMLAT